MTIVSEKSIVLPFFPITSLWEKQVVQRAMITQLSPMCQGQISFKKKKTYKRAMETRGHGNQRPEIALAQAFMPVLVTSNFDDDSIKHE